MPSKKFSRMEDLPGNVALQWSRWGRYPNYLFHEISAQNLHYGVLSNVTAISIAGDSYAPKKAVDWLTQKFSNAKIKEIHLHPAEFNTDVIGHFGIFQNRFEHNIWKLLFEEIVSR